MKTITQDKPLALRLMIRLGGPFGWTWVEQNQLAVIHRMGQYHSWQLGPRLFHIRPWTDRVTSVISTAPDGFAQVYQNIQTRDALEFGVGFSVGYALDPALLPPDRNMAAWVLEQTPDFRQDFVRGRVQRALQEVVTVFNSGQLCQEGAIFAQIEQRCLSELAGLLRPIALKPLFSMVLRFEVPAELRQRYTASVERNVTVQALSQYQPEEFQALMRSEILDIIKNSASTSQFISLADLANLQTAPDQSQAQPRPMVLPGNAGLPRGGPALQTPRPPASPPAAPPPANDPRQRLRKRPRSRL